MAISKKKIIKSLENLSGDLLELIHQQYPSGYQASISRITNAKKEPIFVFPLDTEDCTYLIKVPVTKNSSGEYDVDSKEEEDLDKGEDGFDAGDDFEAGAGLVTQMQITMKKAAAAAEIVKPATIPISIPSFF